MQVQWKRFLSMVMAIVMVVSMIPTNIVFAEENTGGNDGEVVVEPTTEPVTEEPSEPEVTEAETEEPSEPEVTEPVTEKPSEPEVTEAATEEPSEPEETEAATEEPSEPEATEAETEEPSEPVAIGPVTETVTETVVPDVDLPDNQELFAYFVERELYGYDVSTYGTTARSGLTTLEQVLYDALKTKIENVAINGGGTQFILSDISGVKMTWSNTELGVSSIDSGEIVEAAFCSQFDIDKIISALLADCPFDLYWFDKVEGVEMTYQISRSGIDYGAHSVWDTAVVKDLTFVFTVSADYESGENWVTTDVTRVSAAKDLAAQVVAANAGKSDYEKLVAYKNYICNAVTYDHAAAENTATPYGDPWQLISVFDGDDATNVVCEGYAKAFQYLCDLGGLDCISVSGSMAGGTGEGRHMWNVVTLDGANYLVDVTNSDAGSIGQNGGLFLSGGTYQDGYYSFACGSQTIYFICDDLGLSATDYVYEIPVETYTVTVADCENGTVTAESAIAEAGEEVLLTVIPETGYTLQTLTVTWGEDLSVEVTGNKFTMPAGDATVAATFTKTALASGTCGENLTWVLDADGTLTISGTGVMMDFTSSTQPWKDYVTDITSVVIEESVTGIGAYAFYNCSSLTDVTIPSGLTSIGKRAFANCTGLKSIYIPASVTTISAGSYSNSPFYGCSSQMRICCEAASKESGWNTYWSYYGSSSVLRVRYGWTKENYDFWGKLNPDIEELVIPNTVTSIPNDACDDFVNLTTVTIPSSVTKIGDYAFRDCSSLASVVIDEGVTSIGINAFKGCTSLTKIYIPASVTKISADSNGNSPFLDCSRNLKIYCGASAAQSGWGRYWYFYDYGVSGELEVRYGYSASEYDYWTSLSSSITTLEIPDTFTRIPEKALASFKSLKSVKLPAGLKSIGNGAFYYCTSLTDIELPDGLTEIGANAFDNCTALTTLYIPATVTSMPAESGTGAFLRCSESLVVYCGHESEPTEWAEWDVVVEQTYSKKLTANYGYSRAEYEYWINVDKTATTFTIEAGITKIPKKAFYNATNLTNVSIPESVTFIDTGAFAGCSNLENVYVPSATCGPDAFGAVQVYFGRENDGWGNDWNKDGSGYAHFGYTRNDYEYWISVDKEAASIVIPAGITKIPDRFFSGNLYYGYNEYDFDNETLRSVTIPSSVKSIGEDAFKNCVNLTRVTTSNGLETVGEYAFYNCNNLSTIKIPASAKKVAGSAFYGCDNLTIQYAGTKVAWMDVCDGSQPADCSDGLIWDCGECGADGANVMWMLDDSNTLTILGTGEMENFPYYDYAPWYEYTGWDYYYSYIKTIKVLEGVTSIGRLAFYGCLTVTSATIPESVKNIEAYAFSKCYKLKSIDIPRNVEYIGAEAFYDNIALKTITFRHGVNDPLLIDYDAFVLYTSSPVATTVRVPLKTEVNPEIKNYTWTDSLRKVTYASHNCDGKHYIVSENAVEATCTQDGNTGKVYCEVCHKVISADQVVPALGHHVEEWETTREVTYTMDGERQGNCTRCTELIVEELDALGLPNPVAQYVFNEKTGGGMLTWEAIDEVDGYGIYKATSSSGKYTLLTTVEDTELEVNPGVGKTVYYKVKAICNSDDSLSSGYSAVMKAVGQCAQPEIVVEVDAATGKPIISWEKINGAKKYDVYRATAENGTYKKVKTVTTATYLDTTAVVGTTYYYKVRAIASKSTYNSIDSAVDSCLTIVAQPVVTITVDAATGKPVMSWKAVTGAVGYQIYRADDSGNFIPQPIQTNVSYTDTKAAPDTEYRYFVKAIGARDELSSIENPEKVICATPAKPVVTFSIDGVTGEPVLTWNPVEGAVSYKIYRSTSSTKSYQEIADITDLEYRDGTVAAGKSYYYKIMAVGIISQSAYSSYGQLTGKCAQPVITAEIDAATGKPIISWEKINGAKKYDVYRATAENGTYKKVKTVTTATYLDTTAAVGTTYYYKVKAIASKSTYNSVDSDIASCLTIVAQPVVTVSVDAATGKPVMSWKAVTGAVGYQIYRADDSIDFTLLATQTNVSYTDTKAAPDTEHRYFVKAIGAREELSSIENPEKVICATPAKPVVTFSIDGVTGEPVLTWNPVEGAVSYKIYRSTSSTKSYQEVAETTELEYRDETVAAGKSYYYKVMAVGTISQSAYSSYGQLTGKCAQPVITAEIDAATGKPIIKWEKINGAKKYDVYRATAENGTYKKVKTVTTATYLDTTAVVGTTYYYKVRAIASKSTYNSIDSAVDSCLTIVAQPVVTVSVDAATGKPVMSWKAVTGAVGYQVYRADDSGNFIPQPTQTNVSYTDTEATPDTECRYFVKAIGAREELSSIENPEKVICATPAKPVVTFSIDGVTGEPVLTWDAVEGAVSYKIYRSTSSTKSYQEVDEVTGLEYRDGTVAAGKSYYYKIMAVGSISQSAYSSYGQLTGKCAQPEITAEIDAATGKPVIKWEKVDGAKKYDVYRATSENGKYSKLKTTTAASYVDTSAKVGTYYYKVQAVASKSAGNSIFSVIEKCEIIEWSPPIL